MGFRSFVENVRDWIASAPLCPIYLPDYIEAKARLRKLVPPNFDLVFLKRTVDEGRIAWQPVTARPADPADPMPLHAGAKFHIWDGSTILEQLATVLEVAEEASTDPQRFDGQWTAYLSAEAADETPEYCLEAPELYPQPL